jgi:hypothetical protein
MLSIIEREVLKNIKVNMQFLLDKFIADGLLHGVVNHINPLHLKTMI